MKPSSGAVSLTVDKWYLDLVSHDGTAVASYVIGVRWQTLDLRYAACLVSTPSAPPVERHTFSALPWPTFADGHLTWTAESLGVRGQWRALDAPIARRLLSVPAGAIEWSCLVPRGDATIVTAAGTFEGLGYAERLQLTLPPWAMPFRLLRWGRHLSDRHALVWIEWDGDPSMHAVWLDGEPQNSARVDASGVVGLDGQRALHWRPGRDLTRRAVAGVVARAPSLAARVAGRLASMREHKQLSPSSIVDANGRALDRGWTVHEVVTW